MDLQRTLQKLRMRLRSLVGGAALDRELDEELQDHIERLTADHISRGMAPTAARRAAVLAMGGLERRKEECRDVRRTRFVENLARDVHYGVRVLRRTPGFTVVAVLSLALGVGANAAIFQLLDALRLRSLPVEDPRSLAIVRLLSDEGTSGGFDGHFPDLTHPLFERLETSQAAFSDLVAWSAATFDLAEHGESRFVEDGLWVSGNYFEFLGVGAQLGRVFAQGDDVRGCGAPGAVLSDALWRRQFAADRGIVGRSISVNGHALQVIGVARPGFFGVEVGRSFDLALPLCAEALIMGERSRLGTKWNWWLAVMGRLEEGWSLDRASAHLAAISPALFRETLPDGYSAQASKSYVEFRLAAIPGAQGYSQLRQTYSTPLRLLLGLAVAVLLIACANIANLMLARTGARQRELAVRLALGASRWRVARQLLVEAFLISAAGAACAAAIAPVLGRSIVGMMSSEVAPMFIDLRTDWRLLAFASALGIATTILFGVAPAMRGSRAALVEAMASGSRGIAIAGGRTPFGRMLVIAQVALSLVLLTSGLLFGRSLMNLLGTDMGFEPRGVLEVDVDAIPLRLPSDRRQPFFRNLLDRIRELPEVQSAASTAAVPFVNNWSQMIHVDGEAATPKGIPKFNSVTASYFATLRTPFVAGRDFDARDTPSSPRVAVVNEAFQRRFLGARPAVGAAFRVDGPGGVPGPPIEIVGVVGNTKYSSLREPFPAIVYLASAQHTAPFQFDRILIRTEGSIDAARAAVKRAIVASSPKVMFHFHDFREQMLYTVLKDRLMAALCGGFALLAAILAVVGVYGLLAYSTSQRTHEIGVRLALGAQRRSVFNLIVCEAIVLSGAGIAAGALLTLAGGGVAAGMLYGVETRDPSTLGGAAVLLGLAGTLAGCIPAHRASRADVVRALRWE
jgi:predicted permease